MTRKNMQDQIKQVEDFCTQPNGKWKNKQQHGGKDTDTVLPLQKRRIEFTCEKTHEITREICVFGPLLCES